MISTYLAMQNAILARNMAVSRMMQNSGLMLSGLSFGNSQPLQPSFAGADIFELQNKADETKITVYKKLEEELSKALKWHINNSTPKFGGVDYKA